MLNHYKHNKAAASGDPDCLPAYRRTAPIEPSHGPFLSCGRCAYATHGFICYTCEGDCLKTELQKKHGHNGGASQC